MEPVKKTIIDLLRDLIFNIFGRLNYEELISLIAVFKLWNLYVKDRAFTNSHKNNEESTATRIILS